MSRQCVTSRGALDRLSRLHNPTQLAQLVVGGFPGSQHRSRVANECVVKLGSPLDLCSARHKLQESDRQECYSLSKVVSDVLHYPAGRLFLLGGEWRWLSTLG